MKKHITLAAAVLVLMTGVANATTVTTQTNIVHTPAPGPIVVDFRQFDSNGDGLLTAQEVGHKLFYTFDKDGNELIDNKEFDNIMVMTFAPMEKQTIQFVDYNSDGLADQTYTSQERFMQQTGLSRFDPTGTGLSAEKFIESPFKKVDRDLSGQIDVREWTEAYDASIRPMPVNDTFRYNE